ncbi:hypothetical protein Tco_0370771 [Tanacetum coccineum]
MRTRSQSRRRRQQQTPPVVVENFDLEEPIVNQNIVAMADNRTMAQMLQAPIEGYEDAIVVPPINANNFELKQPLINLVQSNKFTGAALVPVGATLHRDDSMFTTIRVISKHQDTQIYGANLSQHLTNQAMLESEACKTYHAYATGEKTPKPKKKKADSESSPKEKPAQASKGKRLKTSLKAAQSTKEKQPATKSKAKGLIVLSEVALTEEEQMRPPKEAGFKHKIHMQVA